MKDKGCEFAPSCLNCPFPKCVIERGRRMALKEQRNREIWSLFQSGASEAELANKFGVCTRTIQRTLKASKCFTDIP